MKKITSLLTAALCILGLSLSPAHAKECKGLSKTKCSSDNSCSWVKGYERKNGVKVSAFCRAKAKKNKKKAKKVLDNKKKVVKEKKDTVKKKATKKKENAKSSTKRQKKDAKKKVNSKKDKK